MSSYGVTNILSELLSVSIQTIAFLLSCQNMQQTLTLTQYTICIYDSVWGIKIKVNHTMINDARCDDLKY